MKGVIDIFPEKIQNGEAMITPFSIDQAEAFYFNVRRARDFSEGIVSSGEFVKLHIGKKLVMSDTDMEKRTNSEFVEKAHGRVLIAGLGIGLIIRNIVDKPDVKEIFVVEKSQDLIDLVHPRLTHKKLFIIQGDIHEWLPLKEASFNTIYFDIWNEISTDNLSDIRFLERRFRKYLDKTDEKRFINSWVKEYLKKMRRREQQQNKESLLFRKLFSRV